MNYKLIPKNYQEDSEQTRKEVSHQITYEKMYHEDYVKSLVDQIETLSDSLQVAIVDSKNRGTQRCAIVFIKKAHQVIAKFKHEILAGR